MGVNPILSQSREWLIQPEALRSMAIAAFSAFAGAGGGERKFPAPVALSGRDRAGRAAGGAALQAGPRAAGSLKFSEIRFRAQRALVGRHMQATPPRVDTWAKLCFISPAPRFNTHRISIHHVH